MATNIVQNTGIFNLYIKDAQISKYTQDTSIFTLYNLKLVVLNKFLHTTKTGKLSLGIIDKWSYKILNEDMYIKGEARLSLSGFDVKKLFREVSKGE